MFISGGEYFESKVFSAVQGKRIEIKQTIDTAPNPDRVHKREFISAVAVEVNGAYASRGLFEFVRSDPWLFRDARKVELRQGISLAPGGTARAYCGSFVSELTGIFMRDWSLAPTPVYRNQGFMPEFILLLSD